MNELQESVIEALRKLIDDDIELIKTQPREESINHRLAQYLENILKEKGLLPETHVVDTEYNKYKEEEKKSSYGRFIRPDILAHKRKSGNKNNLIVIEAKKNYGIKNDIEKIKDLVRSKKYSYSLGAMISYLPEREYVKIKFLTSGNKWEYYQLNKGDSSIIETRR